LSVTKSDVTIQNAAPWERQRGESSQAFEAFSRYLELNSGRSYSKLARELGKSDTLIGRWGSRWSWQSRAYAWDNELMRVAKAAEEQEIKEMKKRHIRASMYMVARSMNELQNIPPHTLTPRDVVHMFKVGVDVERLTRGEVTERTESRYEDTTASNLLKSMSCEELRRIVAFTEEALKIISEDDDKADNSDE